jgi:two-component system phosphate regulon sensor histidine kinase PhoR
MHEEFDGMEITREYVWGVFDPSSGSFFAGEMGNRTSKILNSGHRVSLSCLYKSEQLMLGVYFPNENEVLMWKILPWMIVSLLFVLMVVFAFSFMIFSFMRQKKLSEIKSDFVNNMTHELKTPISTISLASEMLLNPVNQGSEEKTRKYARMIFDENQRLQQQVDQVLQISVLEQGTFKLNITTFNAHDIIEQCITRFELAIKNTNGTIRFQPDAREFKLNADINHFQNVVCNLIDNAVKYSSGKTEIDVTTRNEDGMFVVALVDKGIGISHDNQKMIFEKLYRVPTGNRHDVKGFGLGLYYVKTITEALNGKVKVHSELNKGSVFEVFLPLNVTVATYEG